jgi:hypothetical protein
LATSAIEDADDALDDLDGLINALEFRARAQTSDPPTRASLNQIADRIRNRRSHLKDVLSSLRQPGRFDRTTMLCGEIVLHASELESDLMRALPLVT